MSNCRGQRYENGANMAGIHKVVQACVQGDFLLAIFIPCGCPSLNLVIADGTKVSVKSTSFIWYFKMPFSYTLSGALVYDKQPH